MQTKYVLFDLDGTLLNTLPSIAYYVNAALKEEGLGEIELDAIRYYVGNGADTLIWRSLAHFGRGDDQALFERVFKRYITLYHSEPLYLTTPYDGIMDMLDELEKAGVVCAVLSNKPHYATCEVVKHFFGNRFTMVQGAQDGIPLKPNPEAVYAMIDVLGGTKKEAVYVGDTSVDIDTANNAEMVSVGVAWGFRDEAELAEHGATHIIHHPMEMLDLLK